MEVIAVTDSNISLLQHFIDNIGEAAITFRYFNTRDVSIVNNHVTTLLIIENEKPIVYGHLEKEREEVWLGICVLPEKKGKGYGRLMMKSLIEKATLLGIEKISLTVDKLNRNAIMLYEKVGFKKIEEINNYYKYELHTKEIVFPDV